MSSNYKPIIVGVEHLPNNFELTKKEIQKLRLKGITRIGFEESIFDTRQEYVAAIEAVRREKETDARGNNTLLDIKKAVPKDFNPGGFFTTLKVYAQSLGMEIVPIESPAIIKLDRLLTWRNIRDRIQHGEIFHTNHPPLLFQELQLASAHAATGYPLSYVASNVRTRKMGIRIMHAKPQAIVAGAQHAYEVAQKLRIPPQTATWVYRGKVITAPKTAAERPIYSLLLRYVRFGKGIGKRNKSTHLERFRKRRKSFA